MKNFINKIIIKLFDNPLGRLYLGVPKGKHIYKITKSSAHYYTGEIVDGLPVICTGNCKPSGNSILDKFIKTTRAFSLIAIIFALPKSLLPLFALSDTGAKFPSSYASSGGTDFTNPTNVYADDGNYATGTYQNQDYFYNFDFQIPTGATINGYEAKVKGYYTSSGTRVGNVNIIIYVQTTEKGVLGSGAQNLPINSDGIRTFGGSTTLPTNPPTVSEANDNTTTGIRFKLETSNSGGSGDINIYIDYLTTKIYYTVASGPANVKTYKGLASASVKTCKGLAVASIKTKKGLN